MSTRGQRAVRDALRAKQEDLEQAFFAQAVVTAVAAGTVTVRFPGATAVQTWPRLNPTLGVDVGDVALMGGQPGSWMCLGTLTGVRDLAARDLSVRDLSTRDVTTTGRVRIGTTLDVAGAAGVAGNLDVAGYVAKQGGFVLSQSPQGYPNLYSPAADVSLVGANGQLYVANPANTVARNISAANVSERELKVEHGVVDDGLTKIEKLVAGRWSWADPEARADDSTHVGVYVDELAEVEPDAVRVLPTGERAYEPNAVIALLVSAVQDLAGQVRDLRGQLAGSTTSADQPPYPDQTVTAPGSDGA